MHIDLLIQRLEKIRDVHPHDIDVAIFDPIQHTFVDLHNDPLWMVNLIGSEHRDVCVLMPSRESIFVIDHKKDAEIVDMLSIYYGIEDYEG